VRWLFVAGALGGLAADVLSKIIAVRLLEPQQPLSLLGGVLTLRLIRNPGAAFSLGEQYTFVFALLAVSVIGFVIVKLVPQLGHAGWAVALGLLCAGVTGNLADRLFREPGFLHGHVVDFLQLPYLPVFTRPIFNLADVCITSAAVLIMVLAVIRNVGLDGERNAGRRVEDPAAERD
jgi:signal peptidase II